MEFTMPDGCVLKKMLSDARVTSDGLYVFSCGISPKQMSDVISARIISNGIKGNIYTYSVKQYAESVFNAADGTKKIIQPQEAESSLYYIDIDNVKAYELGDNYNIYIKKKSDDATEMMVECGMFVYARYVYQYSDNEALKNLMKAMYHHNNAAIEYFYFFS